MTSTEKFASFNWMRGVADDNRLTVVQRLVLIRLCFHRKKTGECNPGYETLAKELTVARASVFRAVDVGVECGWLAGLPDHGGRAKRNFVFTFPPQQSHQSDGSTVSPARPLQRATVSKKRSNSLKKGLQQSQRQRASPAKSNASSDNGHLTGKENGQEKDSHPDEAFEAWWRHYPKKVAKGAARKAYQAARRKASEAELLAGVMRYAHERTGEPDKYTKHPAGWLNAERWKDEPAASPARKGSHYDNIARGLDMVPDDDVEIST